MNDEAEKKVIDQNEDIYEEYAPRYQEYKPTEIKIKSGGKRKWLFLCVIIVLLVGGIVVGLTLHFIRDSPTSISTTAPVETISTTAQVSTTQALTVEEDSTTSMSTTAPVTTIQSRYEKVVLMLSTYLSGNVPIRIGFHGESVLFCFL